MSEEPREQQSDSEIRGLLGRTGRNRHNRNLTITFKDTAERFAGQTITVRDVEPGMHNLFTHFRADLQGDFPPGTKPRDVRKLESEGLPIAWIASVKINT